jgi:hypothetical protein
MKRANMLFIARTMANMKYGSEKQFKFKKYIRNTNSIKLLMYLFRCYTTAQKSIII